LEKPKHIFIIVADSLRKDAVYNQGVGMDYVEKNSIQFTQARSSACWTLPATSCMFTGLNVHEHQTDTHTRNLSKNISTLSEHMKAKGYKTIQVTANPVTTEIFGLNRGFDQVFKTWKLVTPKLKKTMYFLLSMSKHRVRNMIFSKDVVSQKLLEDIEDMISNISIPQKNMMYIYVVHGCIRKHNKGITHGKNKRHWTFCI
jgi:hypothetical protein